MLIDLEAADEPAVAWPVSLAAAADAGALPLVNLLHDLDGLVELLAGQVERQSWLNAFLLAAGANQVIEDHLHEDPLSLGRVARHVTRLAPGIIGRAAGTAIGVADEARWQARDAPWAERRAISWQRRLAGLVDRLAACTIEPPTPVDRLALEADLRALVTGLGKLPLRARRSVVRLPSCFRNFDQHPDDLALLTEEFARRWPDVSRRLVVVGVRTSGSYTGPLHAARLRRLGYRAVEVLTFRPERRWRRWERQVLDRVRTAGGLALVTDDPPKSGGSLLKTARELRAAGFAPSSIVPMVQLLEGADLAPQLREQPCVVLEWQRWRVHGRLDAGAVREVLAGMMPRRSVVSVQRCPMPRRSGTRRHVEALYSVRLGHPGSGQPEVVEVLVKGVGLGYFGEHTLVATDAVQDFVPECFGVHEGLSYRRWLSPRQRLGDFGGDRLDEVADGVAGYVTTRAERMRVDEDLSLRLLDRGAVWQRAGDEMAKAFGRWAQLSRPLSYRAARALLRVAQPSVIDGNMAADRWFDPAAPGAAIRKVDHDHRAFSSLDLYSYDPVFDLAGFTGRRDAAAALRRRYRERTGVAVDAERWFLYRLVHLAELRRDATQESAEIERAFARALQDYFAETVFGDIDPPADGPLCVFDLDWTLEARRLGFPGIVPSGAFALRALARHGYRTLLATGRSVAEVRERCEAYRLSGGVAEYGAFVYDHGAGQVRSLLTASDREQLDCLRRMLQETPGVTVDAEHRGAVRAFTFTATGRRRALAADISAAALSQAGLEGAVRVIPGGLQTDFIVNTVDKGMGARALVSMLPNQARPVAAAPFALAVGDSAEDVPFLALAGLALVPARSELAARLPRVGDVTRASGPAGIVSAVATLLGHMPGDCERCRPPVLARRSRLMLSVLGMSEKRGVVALGQVARVAVRLRRLEP